MRYEIDPAKSVYLQVIDSPSTCSMAASVGSAIYRFFDANDVLLYVGMTSRPRERWYAHSRTAGWWSDVRAVTISDRMREHPARLAERHAIAVEMPRHNIAMVVKAHA